MVIPEVAAILVIITAVAFPLTIGIVTMEVKEGGGWPLQHHPYSGPGYAAYPPSGYGYSAYADPWGDPRGSYQHHAYEYQRQSYPPHNAHFLPLGGDSRRDFALPPTTYPPGQRGQGGVEVDSRDGLLPLHPSVVHGSQVPPIASGVITKGGNRPAGTRISGDPRREAGRSFAGSRSSSRASKLRPTLPKKIPQLGKVSKKKKKLPPGEASLPASVVRQAISDQVEEDRPVNGHLEDVRPEDSISQVATRTASSHPGADQEVDSEGSEDSSPESIMEKAVIKKDFVDMIRGMEDKPVEQVQTQPADAMAAMFGAAKAYFKGKASMDGISMTEHQRGILTHYLSSTEAPDRIRKNLPIGRSGGIPIQEDDYKRYFRPATINPSLVEQIRYTQTGKKKKFKRGKGSQFTWSSPVARETEEDLTRLDRLNRLGLRFATYEGWLLTCLKSLVVGTLGAEHELVQTNGTFEKIVKELFESSTAQMELHCRSILTETISRRKLVLAELKFKDEPHESALDLPLDSSGEFLFGSTKSDEDKVVSIDTIAKDFAKKMVGVREAKAAYSDPKAVILPSGLPEEKGQSNNSKGWSGNKGYNKGYSKRGGKNFKRGGQRQDSQKRNYNNQRQNQNRRGGGFGRQRGGKQFDKPPFQVSGEDGK